MCCWYFVCARIYAASLCVCVCACMRDCVGAHVYIGWAGRALRHGGATCPRKREWLMPGTRYIPAESSWRHDEFMKSTPMARHIRILCECVVAATLACLLLARPLSADPCRRHPCMQSRLATAICCSVRIAGLRGGLLTSVPVSLTTCVGNKWSPCTTSSDITSRQSACADTGSGTPSWSLAVRAVASPQSDPPHDSPGAPAAAATPSDITARWRYQQARVGVHGVRRMMLAHHVPLSSKLACWNLNCPAPLSVRRPKQKPDTV